MRNRALIGLILSLVFLGAGCTALEVNVEAPEQAASGEFGGISNGSLNNPSDTSGLLSDVVDDTTPQLGGDLDAQGNDITDMGDVTFKTGATGGTLRTGTSNADKFQLQAYDVNGMAYQKLMEADAGNEPTLEVFDDSFEIRNSTDETKKIDWDVSGASASSVMTLASPHTAARTLTLPDATDTLVGKATTDTLTNKSVDLANNTLTGSTAQFNTALSDGSFCTLAGTESLTNKTLTDAIADGTSLTLGGGASATQLRFLEPSGGGSSYVSFASPALGANKTFTLPNDYGTSGYALIDTDGAGTLGWASVATGGDLSISSALPTINFYDTDGTDADINAYFSVDLTSTLSAQEDTNILAYQQNNGTIAQSFLISSEYESVAIGYDALDFALTGTSDGNVAIGDDAMRAATSNTRLNVAIGEDALRSATTNTVDNVVIGNSAADLMTAGDFNVIIGSDAGDGALDESADGNVLIGYLSAGSLVTGSNNVIIGREADSSSSSNSNQVTIGYNVTGGGSNTVTIGNSSVTKNFFQKSLFLTEQASATTDLAGSGQLWVLSSTPNVLMFTDDAGTDFTVATNATTALSSLGTISTGLTGVLRADSGVLSVDSDVTDLVDNIAVSQLADGTDGELITWSATGAPTTVAAGTSGQVLTSNGAGAAPTFQDAAAGGSAILQFQAVFNRTTSGTSYYSNTTNSTTETNLGTVTSFAGTLEDLTCNPWANTASGGTDTTFTVYKNGTGTAVTLNITNSVTTVVQDTSNTVAVAAGDRITIQGDFTLTSGSISVACSVSITP